jgi:RHS repeat-associated protein
VHRPLSARDASGRVWRFEWDRHAHLRQLSATLPADPKREIAVARYDYSDAGNLTSAEVFDLRRFVYAWNQHMLVSYTLPDGAVFRQEWDVLTPAGKCIRSYAVDGTFDDRIAFADDGSQAIHTDVLGRVSRHYFDEHHLHTGSIDAVGHRTHILLDPNGNPTATIDELGRETKTVFDARGNLVSRKDAAGAETKVEYEAFDLPIRIVDALGQVWSRSYDDHGNLIEAIDPLGQKTRFDYDTHGQLTRVVDAKGGVNTLAWSANGELLSYTDCSGKTTRFEHDAWGRPVGTIDALQQVSRQILDALGRVVEQRDAANAVHRFEWDPMDRLRTYIDPLGATTRFEYDKGGRPVVRRNALGREVRYEYDQAGRLAKLFNEKGEPYRFAYDALDRLVEEIGFDGRLQRYGYNAAGELTRLIEPGGGETGPGRVTRFDRDALGRLVGKVSGDDANATFAYDPLGRLLKAVNPVAATTFAYDALDNVLSESHALSVPGLAPRLLAFNHAYDPLGNRIETVLPSGRRAIFQYYGSGHLHGVLLDGEVLSNLERDDLHREVTRTQGALRTEFAYDPQGRLTQTRTLTQQGRGEVPIIDRRYRYDIAGRLQTRSDALRRSAGSAIVQREYVYQHDALGQLVGARLGGAVSLSELFAFDPAGNLLPGAEGASGQSAGLVQGNRLLVFQDMRFTYDVYGNVVEKRKGAHQSWQFSYDTEHRLTAATSAHHGTAQTTRYYYDPFGRRVAKSDAFAATVFGWDGNRMSHEARGSRVSEYLYEPESFVPLAKLEASSDAPPAGGPAGGSARVYHFHVNQIGTPQELTAPSGEVVWRVTARAWGNVLVEEVAEVEQPLRFQGQYHDAETGLHYNRYRYYDADVGRYASCDPISLRGGQNVYAYAAGDPTLWVDPTGLCPKGTKTLFHYTDEAGMKGIVESEKLLPSLKRLSPKDARYGNGQYLSDVAPGTMSCAQLSRCFVGQPFQGQRFTHFVEIDVTGLNVVKGRDGVFVVPNEGVLDLAGRIIRSGVN